MSPFTCNPWELQIVKDALDQNPLNAGVGIAHEQTGQIYLAPFDQVPGGHMELVSRSKVVPSECKGFVILKRPDGTFIALNHSHLNGPQGQPGSLQMRQPSMKSCKRSGAPVYDDMTDFK